MPNKRRYYLLTCALCAGAAGIVAIMVHGPLGPDGPLLDLLVTARALVLPTASTPTPEPVVVITLEQRSLASPELVPYPRTSPP